MLYNYIVLIISNLLRRFSAFDKSNHIKSSETYQVSSIQVCSNLVCSNQIYSFQILLYLRKNINVF